MKLTKIIFYVIIIVVVYISYKIYYKKYKNNVKSDYYLYIPSGTDFKGLKKRIENKLIDYNSFEELAIEKKYQEKIKPGKYKIYIGESNPELLEKLISANQEPVILNIQSFDHISYLLENIRLNIEADSISIKKAFIKELNQKKLSDLDDIKKFIIPGKYQILWNDDPSDIIKKITSKYYEFWNESRKKQAENLGLTIDQIIIIASITQGESNKKDEQPKIAGLYINRLKKSMKLQSDPTVIFAKKKKEGFDKVFYRVYYKDLFIDSPYNTYKYLGLPPTAINSPNASTIDAVLNSDRHNYIYMCANPQKPGYHDFTSDYSKHQINAKKYQEFLNKKNIK